MKRVCSGVVQGGMFKGVCSREYVEMSMLGSSPMGYVQGGMSKRVCLGLVQEVCSRGYFERSMFVVQVGIIKGVCRKEYVRE